MKGRFTAVAIVVLAWQMPLHSQQRVSIDAAVHTSDRPYIQATGHASSEAKPDQAFITIGVVTEAPTAPAAAAENAKQTDTVLGELRKLLGDGDHLKTTNYSVRPVYQTPKPGSVPVIGGYTATNLVEVTVDNLTQVEKIVDTAAQSGANNMAEETVPEEEIGVYKKAAPKPAAVGVPTPVEIGTIEVEATVTLRLEVAP